MPQFSRLRIGLLCYTKLETLAISQLGGMPTRARGDRFRGCRVGVGMGISPASMATPSRSHGTRRIIASAEINRFGHCRLPQGCGWKSTAGQASSGTQRIMSVSAKLTYDRRRKRSATSPTAAATAESELGSGIAMVHRTASLRDVPSLNAEPAT
jgi:hypothetical protein